MNSSHQYFVAPEFPSEKKSVNFNRTEEYLNTTNDSLRKTFRLETPATEERLSKLGAQTMSGGRFFRPVKTAANSSAVLQFCSKTVQQDMSQFTDRLDKINASGTIQYSQSGELDAQSILKRWRVVAAQEQPAAVAADVRGRSTEPRELEGGGLHEFECLQGEFVYFRLRVREKPYPLRARIKREKNVEFSLKISKTYPLPSCFNYFYETNQSQFTLNAAGHGSSQAPHYFKEEYLYFSMICFRDVRVGLQFRFGNGQPPPQQQQQQPQPPQSPT